MLSTCLHRTSVVSCAQFVGMPVAAVQQILVKVSVNCTSHPKYCGSRRIPEAAVQASDRLISDLQLLDEWVASNQTTTGNVHVYFLCDQIQSQHHLHLTLTLMTHTKLPGGLSVCQRLISTNVISAISYWSLFWESCAFRKYMYEICPYFLCSLTNEY